MKHMSVKRVGAIAAMLPLAALSAVSVAIADNIQNDVVASGVPPSKTVTVTAGGTGATVNYTIAATSNDATDTTGKNGENCNAVSGAATVTPTGMPAGVSANPTSVTFDDCSTSKGITFAAGAAATAGSYPITVNVSDPNNAAGDYNTNPGSFVLVVQAPSAPADTTGPSITISTPGDGASFGLNQNVFAHYGCSDPSGVASCLGPVAHGTAINTGAIGSHPFKVNAEDALGNKSDLTHNYSVVYGAFTGFFAPIDMPSTGKINAVKAGSSVPVKFQLADANGASAYDTVGLNILATGSPSSKKIDCDTSADVSNDTPTTSAGASSLSYDNGTYSYVWKTDKLWAGQCRALIVSLNDGTSHTVNFKVMK